MRRRGQPLGVYDDEEGFMRCKGRIGKAKIKFVREAHENVSRNGVKETLADDVRAKYWIVKEKQNVKKVVRCYLCRILVVLIQLRKRKQLRNLLSIYFL